jgi:hypothetical protein
MNPTPHTQPSHPSFGEIIEEVLDLGAGLAIVLLPLFLLAVPAIGLFVFLPAVLLGALAVALAAVGAVLAAPPYLLARWLRRRRRRPTAPPRRPAKSGAVRHDRRPVRLLAGRSTPAGPR